MAFVLLGVNHKTCPLEVRERFFLAPAQREVLLAEFKADPRVLSALVLSTCNRTEIYAELLGEDPAVLVETFFRIRQLSCTEDLERYFYFSREEKAVEHLLEVACGLDSLILGEKQVLGQVKEAFQVSRARGMLGRTMNILGRCVVEAGKKVRRETAIGCGGSSVSWAAVAKARHVLGSLEGKDILVIGSGKMGSLAVRELRQKGAGRIFIMNRTDDKARELACQWGVTAVKFWQIKEVLMRSDVCICSAGAPHYLVERGLAQEIMPLRPERPLLMIDIAVPRNIDPGVSGIPGVILFTVDDLSQMVQGTLELRRSAIEDVRRIIAAKAGEFYKTLDKAGLYDVLHAR
jgi:glutamyl-tRNA reductase